MLYQLFPFGWPKLKIIRLVSFENSKKKLVIFEKWLNILVINEREPKLAGGDSENALKLSWNTTKTWQLKLRQTIQKQTRFLLRNSATDK